MGLFDWLFKKQGEQTSVHNPAGPIVLVVGDTGDALARVLGDARRQVLVLTHNEPHLVEQLAASGPACVVMEVQSAGATDFHIIKWIKSDKRLGAVPLVVFSFDVDAEIFNQHSKLRTRADAYVASGDPNEIHAAVRPLLAPASSA